MFNHTSGARWVVALMLLLTCAVGHALEAPASLRAVLEKVLHDTPYQVTGTPVNGLYEVLVGSTVYYFTADGRHMLRGVLVDLASGENLTEATQSKARKDELDKLSGADFIEFAAAKPLYRVTVFTDIDCGYCRKLHHEMADYNAMGITVRYLAFPRAGIGSASFAKAVSVWCAKDRQAAMNRAKDGEQLANGKCKNSVAEQFRLGEQMGIQGTPNIVLEDGTMLRGYYPPENLLEVLKSKT